MITIHPIGGGLVWLQNDHGEGGIFPVSEVFSLAHAGGDLETYFNTHF